MHHYDIYRDQLAITHPSFGHALWDPAPEGEYGPVKVGDVGYVREGRFFRLFNALLPADDPSHNEIPLPEHHEPLIPNVRNHLYRGTPLRPDHYCSAGVNIAPAEPDYLATGPEEADQASFSYRGRRGGAVLSIPVEAQRQDTRARGDFGKWILKHIDRWFAFARELGLGINQMEEIILVTGCDCTRSWANVTFLEGRTNGQASFGVRVDQGNNVSISWRFSPGKTQGAVCNWGPGGQNLPEDQCIFIRGFRVARVLGILPKQLKGAAGPKSSPEGDHDDDEPDKELISIPASTKYRDPLHVLLDCIAERVPDCDMVLVHDDDLAHIQGFSNRKEFLKPDVLMDHLKIYLPEIQQIKCDLSIDEDSLRTSSRETRSVAMLSEELRGWCVIPPRQSILGFGQSHPCRPDRPTSDVFMIASPRKHPFGDYRTLGARQEHVFRVVIGLPSQVPAGTPGQELRVILPTFFKRCFRCMTGMLDTVVRMMKYTISITLAMIVCTYPLAMVAPPVKSALAPICSIPILSLLCPDTGFGALAPPPYLDRAPLWADFPDLLDVECKTLEVLFDEVVEGPGFALEIEKAETTMNGFSTLARVSDLNGREALADSLSEFVKDAQKVCRGLTHLRSRMGLAMDNFLTVNLYVLYPIGDVNSPFSGLSFRRLRGFQPSRAYTKQIVTRTFIEAMDALSTDVHRLVLEGEVSISNLNNLEDHLRSILEVFSRGDSSMPMPESELLAQFLTISTSNRGQLVGMDKNLALLEGLSGYRDRALGYIVSALRTLEIVVEDMKKLREHIAEPELVSDAIPLDINSLMGGLERLKGRRVGTKELEEQIVNRVSGSMEVGEIMI